MFFMYRAKKFWYLGIASKKSTSEFVDAVVMKMGC